MNQGQPTGSDQQGLGSARRRSAARWELKSRVALTALQTLSHMPPMEITLDKLSRSAAVRLLKLPFRSLVSEHLPDVWRDKRPGLHPPPFLPPERLPHTKYTRPFSSIEFLATLASPRGERVFPFAAENAPGIPRLSEYPHLTIDDFEAILFYGEEGKQRHVDSINEFIRTRSFRDQLHFFCDGSLTDDGAGAAHVLYRSGATYRNKFGCGKKATAYDAEMLALAAAAR